MQQFVPLYREQGGAREEERRGKGGRETAQMLEHTAVKKNDV